MKRYTIIFFGILIIAGNACKKTPDYVPAPYACNCGKFKWAEKEYDLLNTAYILADSTESESRRYYITADVALEGEEQTHGLNAWIEIPDLDGGGQFQVDADAGIYQFNAWVDEFNLNDPIDSLRQYIPAEGVVQVQEAPISGGVETVTFLLTLNEVVDGMPLPGPVNCSGSFTVNVNPY